jgi:hypothetical protein
VTKPKDSGAAAFVNSFFDSIFSKVDNPELEAKLRGVGDGWAEGVDKDLEERNAKAETTETSETGSDLRPPGDR